MPPAPSAGMRLLGGLVFAAALLSPFVTASPATAQGFCVRGQPSPRCSTFLIFELQVHRAFAGDERVQVDSSTALGPDGQQVPRIRTEPVKGFAWAVGAEVGLGYNLSPDWALGATIGWEALGGDGTTAGPRKVIAGRARRWLENGLALDLEGGVFVFDGSTYSQDIDEVVNDRVIGALLGTRLSMGSLGFVALRWDAMSLEPYYRDLGSPNLDPGGFHHALSVGAGLGSQAGMGGALLFFAVLGAIGPIPPT